MSTPIPSNTLTGQEISSPSAPCNEARAINVRCDFTGSTEFSFDLNSQIERGFIDTIRSAFVDNSENPNEFVIFVPSLNQEIKVPANHQGFFPLFTTNPTNLAFRAVAGVTKLTLYNIPMPLAVWSTP